MDQESRGDGFSRGERSADREVQRQSLSIHITNVDTTLVSKENGVTLTLGGDADIVFGVGWVREERLYDEVVEGAGSALDLKRTNIVSTSPK